MNAILSPKKNHLEVIVMVLLFMLTLTLTYKMVFGEGGFIQYKIKEEELRSKKDKNKQIVSKNAKIAIVVKALKASESLEKGQSSEIMEEHARFHNNLIKPDEVVYKIQE